MPERMAGIVIDRFGKEVEIRKKEDGYCSVRVNVAVSDVFFGWLTGLGPEVKLVAPEHVVGHYQTYLKNILNRYEEAEYETHICEQNEGL